MKSLLLGKDVLAALSRQLETTPICETGGEDDTEDFRGLFSCEGCDSTCTDGCGDNCSPCFGCDGGAW
jgi:hypothetical protein